LIALFILILLGVLSYFAYHGKAMPDPIAYAIYGLITTATGMLTALAGHAAGAKNPASAAVSHFVTGTSMAALPGLVVPPTLPQEPVTPAQPAAPQ